MCERMAKSIGRRLPLLPLLLLFLGAGGFFAGAAAPAVPPSPPVEAPKNAPGAAAARAKAGNVESILASVNGRGIALSDVLLESKSEETRAYLAYSGLKLRDAIRDIRKRRVDDIIARKLLLEVFEKDPFQIPTQIVERSLDEMAEAMGCRSRGEFNRRVLEDGGTPDEIREKMLERIRVQGVLSRYLYARLNLTPRELHEYAVKHAAQFEKAETLALSLIAVKPERSDAKERIARLSRELTPANFGNLAAALSDGPNAGGGGALGSIERPRLRADFAKAIGDKAEVNKIYGPVETSDGTYFLMVTRLEPARRPDLAEITGRLRDGLESKMRRKLFDAYVEELRRNAIIVYYF